ncbi:unnamed protein product, partial [Symbiodinium sp. CCMP2456]
TSMPTPTRCSCTMWPRHGWSQRWPQFCGNARSSLMPRPWPRVWSACQYFCGWDPETGRFIHGSRAG